MIDYIINPVTAYVCFFLAIFFFRKEKTTIGQALMLPLQRAALQFKPGFADIFTVPGIVLLILGSIIAFAYVALI